MLLACNVQAPVETLFPQARLRGLSMGRVRMRGRICLTCLMEVEGNFFRAGGNVGRNGWR
ncbi:hypothetical protein IQ07DRAFT_116927 [Pyrenochaeta sp. DS3sAY3a]|nr:hypothetical protein IQ07DRAFT_116927 [Pyrenochaeta sp. DS3sAY3a]